MTLKTEGEIIDRGFTAGFNTYASIFERQWFRVIDNLLAAQKCGHISQSQIDTTIAFIGQEDNELAMRLQTYVSPSPGF